jgi:hypothetical protein
MIDTWCYLLVSSVVPETTTGAPRYVTQPFQQQFPGLVHLTSPYEGLFHFFSSMHFFLPVERRLLPLPSASYCDNSYQPDHIAAPSTIDRSCQPMPRSMLR